MPINYHWVLIPTTVVCQKTTPLTIVECLDMGSEIFNLLRSFFFWRNHCWLSHKLNFHFGSLLLLKFIDIHKFLAEPCCLHHFFRFPVCELATDCWDHAYWLRILTFSQLSKICLKVFDGFFWLWRLLELAIWAPKKDSHYMVVAHPTELIVIRQHLPTATIIDDVFVAKIPSHNQFRPTLNYRNFSSHLSHPFKLFVLSHDHRIIVIGAIQVFLCLKCVLER
jgi:hypothetical protein